MDSDSPNLSRHDIRSLKHQFVDGFGTARYTRLSNSPAIAQWSWFFRPSEKNGKRTAEML